MERSITANGLPSLQTGIVSCLTGTPRRHSGSPSRQIRLSATAIASSGCSPRADGADDVVRQRRRPGRRATCASAIQECSASSGAHSDRSAKDRSASSSQSETSACSHSRSSGAMCARLARSFIVGIPASSHIGRSSADGAVRLLAQRAPGPRVLPGNVAAMASDQQAVTHGGAQAVAAARAHGAQTIFTLSGGHVFPVYDGAVKADPPMPILDVRHEQTAVFAAEATARLTRTPGFAVLTAGPGVTNGISAITTAHFNGSSVVVLGGRAPDYRWGAGSLQEFDHPALLGPITKRAWTEHSSGGVGRAVSEAFALAAARHRGPVFLDVSLEALFGSPDPADQRRRPSQPDAGSPPDRGRRARRWQHRGHRRAAREGGAAGARARLGRLAGRGRRRPRGRPPRNCSFRSSRTDRAAAFSRPATSCWSPGQVAGLRPGRSRHRGGTPLDFRLGYGEYGGKDGAASPPRSCTSPTPPSQIATHRPLAASAAGDLAAFFTGLTSAAQRSGLTPSWAAGWLPDLTQACEAARRGGRRAAGERRLPDPPDADLRRARARCWNRTPW